MRSVCIWVVLLLSAGPAVAQQEGVVAYERLLGSQNQTDPLDIMILGDGWLRSDLPEYRQVCAKMLEGLLRISPYKEYAPFLRVTRADVISKERGMGYEAQGVRTNTYFGVTLWAKKENPFEDSNFIWFDKKRELEIIGRLYWATKGTMPTDIIVVIANNKYQTYGTAFLPAGPAVVTCDPKTMPQALAHELGHAIGFLEDEYVGTLPPPTVKDFKPFTDFPHANATIYPERTKIKWSHWMDRPEVGIFEGGACRIKGVWRSGFDCMMNFTHHYEYDPFCSVCRSSIIEWIYEYASPVGSIYPAKTSYTVRGFASLPSSFRVRTMWVDETTVDCLWIIETTGRVYNSKNYYRGRVVRTGAGCEFLLDLPFGFQFDYGTTTISCNLCDITPMARYRTGTKVYEGVPRVFQTTWKFERTLF